MVPGGLTLTHTHMSRVGASSVGRVPFFGVVFKGNQMDSTHFGGAPKKEPPRFLSKLSSPGFFLPFRCHSRHWETARA